MRDFERIFIIDKFTIKVHEEYIDKNAKSRIINKTKINK